MPAWWASRPSTHPTTCDLRDYGNAGMHPQLLASLRLSAVPLRIEVEFPAQHARAIHQGSADETRRLALASCLGGPHGRGHLRMASSFGGPGRRRGTGVAALQVYDSSLRDRRSSIAQSEMPALPRRKNQKGRVGPPHPRGSAQGERVGSGGDTRQGTGQRALRDGPRREDAARQNEQTGSGSGGDDPPVD